MSNVETEQIEYKTSFSDRDAIIDTVAAFATSKGGKIYIGITPDGTKSGVMIGDNTLAKLANEIKRTTEPPQFPSLSVEGDTSSTIVLITVSESPIKPVFARNRPMKRVGDSNQVISRDETHRLMDMSAGHTWDAIPCPEFTVDMIDRSAVEYFLRISGQDTDLSTQNVLETLQFTRSGVLSNAAALLFAKDPQRFFVQAQVKCGRFAGTDSVRFLDERTFYGNVIEQINQAMEFVRRNTSKGIIITGKPQHDIENEYPEEAIREAIINAVCHRSYSDVAHVQVRIYDDRLEVWSPGGLPPDLPVEMLYCKHHSRPRNPNLAQALHRARMIEQWGTGTLRMVQACESHSMPRPEFTYQGGMFIVSFVKPTVGQLNERQRQALEYVRVQGTITTREYASKFQVSPAQAKRDLALLVDTGCLVIIGKGPATYYALPTR